METMMADTDHWADLIEALTLLSKHQTGPFPTHCEHDELWVMSDPDQFTDEELERLEELGFRPSDEASFTSYLFGSA